jgi:tyrosinase
VERRHTLSNDEKLEYIHAELCLMQKPAVLGLPGPRTRFDDLQAVHQRQAYAVHFAVSNENAARAA